MRNEPLSEHCSLMAHPERTVRPSDCPEDAAYIRVGNQGGSYALNPITPFPLVVEGGDGNDQVIVNGTPRNPVIIDGGRGDDRVIMQNERGSGPPAVPIRDKDSPRAAATDGQRPEGVVGHDPWSSLMGELTPVGLTFLGSVLITFVTLGVIGWRALGSR